jgi:predicted CxxxxCH...CXXCH cytochrome family protein
MRPTLMARAGALAGAGALAAAALASCRRQEPVRSDCLRIDGPQAPVGSLKAMNPSSAAYVAGPTPLTDDRGLPYTNGTCSSVYCHSYNNWTTTALVPENDPNWQTKVVVTRIYRSVTWGGAPLGCSGCHGNPTQTAYPANDGAGDPTRASYQAPAQL